MRVIINEGEQLKYKPIKSEIKESLEARQSNKEFVYNTTPFVRLSCLQKVTIGDNTYDGFTFNLTTDFDSSYGERQIIGQQIGLSEQLNNSDVTIDNPRRVPPITLSQFVARQGEDAGYYSTMTLEFTCHSLEQLEFITPFLFYPGNYVLAEWGNNIPNYSHHLFSSVDMTLLEKTILNKVNFDEKTFYQKYDEKILSSKGNYEYLGGVILSFDFSANTNLGYDCKVELASMSYMKNMSTNSDTNDTTPNNREAIEFKLRKFQETLINNSRVDRLSHLLEIGSSASDKYVTLESILDFLSNKLIKKIPTLPQSSVPLMSEGQVTSIPFVTQDVVSGITSRELLYTKNAKSPIIPVTSDILIFRSEMYDKILPNITGFNYSPTLISALSSTDRRILNKSLVSIGLASSTKRRLKSMQRLETIQEVTVNFSNKQQPLLVDSIRDSNSEDASRFYVNFNKFSAIYRDSNAVVNDCIKKVIDLIYTATGERLQLKIFGGVTSDTTKRNTARIVDTTSAEIDNTGDTYEFKLNSKDSIVTEFNFSVSTFNEFASMIYASRIDKSDNTKPSQQLNLLLFGDDVDTTVNDVVSTAIKKATPKDTKKDDDEGTNVTSSDINELESADIVQNYLGKLFVSNTIEADLTRYSGNIPTSSITVNPTNDSDTFIIEIILPFTPGRGGSSGTEYGYNEIEPMLKSIFNIVKIPLVFSKTKENTLPSTDTSSNVAPIIDNITQLGLIGIGGINALEYFKLSGIPSAYTERGSYVIQNVTHVVNSRGWTTQLVGGFRLNK